MCILCLNDDDCNNINDKAITTTIKVKIDYHQMQKKKIDFTSFSPLKNHNYFNYMFWFIILFRFSSLNIVLKTENRLTEKKKPVSSITS